jgi:signal transduction histidine kinase
MRLRRVVSGRAHKRGLGRLTLRQRLVAIGAAGLVLTLVVMQAALSGLGTVNREHATVDTIKSAQQFHQDADMQHDALHSDVFRAFMASGGQIPVSRAETLARVADDAGVFRHDLDSARALGLSAAGAERERSKRLGSVSGALESVRPKEELYIATAQRVSQLAFTDRTAAQAALAPFEQLFRELEVGLADVTTQVAQAADHAEADAHREIGSAQHRILAASVAALVGLLALALMLDRVGKQLAESLTEVEAHVDAVVRSEQHSRDFLAYAAHQLRTPVSATRASAEALLLRGATRAQEELLSALIKETGRAGRLVTALLRMARLDQGEVPTSRPCDVLDLCVQELERMAARAPALRWLLEAHGPVPSRVLVSPDATSEALANLLDNASRHAQSAVVVRVSTVDGSLRISVYDDGPGLPDVARVSAFERFVSLDGHGGSGLGLPIARGLAQAQGGELRYEPDGFVLTLPLGDIEDDLAA